jgi:hypothetical protein
VTFLYSAHAEAMTFPHSAHAEAVTFSHSAHAEAVSNAISALSILPHRFTCAINAFAFPAHFLYSRVRIASSDSDGLPDSTMYLFHPEKSDSMEIMDSPEEFSFHPDRLSFFTLSFIRSECDPIPERTTFFFLPFAVNLTNEITTPWHTLASFS